MTARTRTRTRRSKLGHLIVTGEGGIEHYKPNALVCYLRSHGKADLNVLWDLYGSEVFTREEMMQFYRDIGYTLDGFEELFGVRE